VPPADLRVKPDPAGAPLDPWTVMWSFACYLRSPMLGAIFETHVLGQIIRHFANQGRRREIYFYRDHHGREVDFLIPSAGRFALIECKWAESPGSKQRGFSELESLVGADRIISQTIVTPERGSRRASERVTIADSVALGFLSNP
jgi:predicted AAA+ superfamily ATPase